MVKSKPASKLAKKILVSSLIMGILIAFVSFSANAVPVNIKSQSAEEVFPLVVEKTVDSTEIYDGDSITVKITLNNLNKKPVYDVEVTEVKFTSPAFKYKGLDTNIIRFQEIDAHETKTLYYIIEVVIPQEKNTNLTLQETKVTYYLSQDSGSRTQYKSFSESIELHFLGPREAVSEPTVITNEELYYILFMAIIVLYIFILLIQTVLTRITKS